MFDWLESSRLSSSISFMQQSILRGSSPCSSQLPLLQYRSSSVSPSSPGIWLQPRAFLDIQSQRDIPFMNGSAAPSFFAHYSSIKFMPYNLAKQNEALHLIKPQHFGPAQLAHCPSISMYCCPISHTKPSIYHQSCQKPPKFSSSLPVVLHGDTSVSRQRPSTLEPSLLKDNRACSSCLMRSCFFRLLESGRLIETFSGFSSIEFSQQFLERARQLPSDTKISHLVFTRVTLSEKDLWTYGSLGMGVNARTYLSYTLRTNFYDYSVLQAVLRLMASFSWFISLASTTRFFKQDSPAPYICTYLRIPQFKLSSGGEGGGLSG